MCPSSAVSDGTRKIDITNAEHDAERHRETELLQERDRREREDGERTGENDPGRGHRRSAVLDPDRGGLAGFVPLAGLLP